MDPNRFDALTKVLPTPHSRRRLVRRLAGGAAAALGAGFDQAVATRPCRSAATPDG